MCTVRVHAGHHLLAHSTSAPHSSCTLRRTPAQVHLAPLAVVALEASLERACQVLLVALGVHAVLAAGRARRHLLQMRALRISPGIVTELAKAAQLCCSWPAAALQDSPTQLGLICARRHWALPKHVLQAMAMLRHSLPACLPVLLLAL